MKKILTALLGLGMLLNLLPSVPVQAEAHPDDELFYAVEDGYAVIVDCDVEYENDLIIPDTLDGYLVTGISDTAFIQCSGFGTMTIPHSLTSIAPTVLDECSVNDGIWVDKNNPAYSSDEFGVLFNKDKSILIKAPRLLSDGYTIPDSVKTIGRYAFQGCKNLTEITIPEGVTHIEERAFFHCGSLTQITVPDSVCQVGLFALKVGNDLAYTMYNDGKYLGNSSNPYHVFLEMLDTSVTEYSIHPDTKVLAGGAFYETNDLVSITIPEGVVSIGERAFDCCMLLPQISLPDSLRHIGYGAFGGCDALTEISIGADVTEIGSGVFTNCTSLSGIWVDADNPAYCSDDQGVLYNKNKTVLHQAPCAINGSYAVADGVTVIEESAFYRCASLQEVTLPETVTKIGDFAFGQSNVTAVNIPTGVTQIGTFAFCYSKLSTVNIPDNVTYIGDGAFSNCSYLTKATFPKNLTEIGPWLFRSCTRLAEINIPASVTRIGYGAFEGCSNVTHLTIPEGVTAIDRSAFASCFSLTDVSIAESVVDIGTGAFSGCQNLNYSYTWQGPGRYLGNEQNPFLVLMGVSDTDIEEFTVAEGTKIIAGSALAQCDSMETVTLPEGLVSIGSDAFYNCGRLSRIYIPDTVTFIGDGAFRSTGLTELTIPKSVTHIGESVFYECKKLEAVRFSGEAPEMHHWVFNQLTTTVYCHADRESWAKHIGRNYLGTITWAEGHVFRNYLPDEGFNCTTGGTKTAKCDGCDATDTVTVTETAEHRYEKGKCTVCGEMEANSCFMIGTLTSSGDSDTILILIQNGETVYSLTVTGNTFVWDGLQPGEYSLTAVKDNHVTYRTAVTVTSGENTLDLTLCRPGDVVGIGDLNMGDFAAIYAHIRGTSSLTGYAQACADFDGNGSVNMGDVSALYARIRNAG